MPRSSRANPLALAVLICLYERPMHPYEMATVLREREKHESVRLNYGSLYAVVETLSRRGLIAVEASERSGRLPERTVYALTPAGLAELRDWLSELVSMPVKEYPAFQAALSFLPALPPDEAVALLRERQRRLRVSLAQAEAVREMCVEQGELPRLFWIEHEFSVRLKEAELRYVQTLADDIASGAIDGIEAWRALHSGGIRPSRPHEPAGGAGGDGRAGLRGAPGDTPGTDRRPAQPRTRGEETT